MTEKIIKADDILIEGQLEYTNHRLYMDWSFLKRLRACLSLLFRGWCYVD